MRPRVCMWRSARIQGRSASGSPSRRCGAPARAEAAVERVELRGDLARRSSTRPRRAPPPRAATGRRRPRRAGPSRRRRARAASRRRRGRRSPRPRRRPRGAAARGRRRPGRRSRPRPAPARVPRRRAASAPRCARRAPAARTAAPRAASYGADEHPPVRQLAERPDRGLDELALGRRPLDDDQPFASRPAGTARGRRRPGRSRSRRGSARPPRRRPGRRPRPGRRRGRAAARAGPCPAGSRAAGRRGSVATASAFPSRSARYERLGIPGSKPWTTSKSPPASASSRRRARAERHPTRLRRETGTAGPIATTSRAVPASSARRLSRRSRGRLEGASTVTSCPSARSSAATPATCSLTSWGCDHVEGRDEADAHAGAGHSSAT